MQTKQLSEDNWGDFEKLFFTSHQCKECWCLNHRVHPDEELTGEPARLKMKEMVAQGVVGGLLGYKNNDCVGWISVDPLESQKGHDYLLGGHKSSADTWTIHCLYVAPDHRGAGVSKQLIEAGIEFAKSKGAKRALSFPIPKESREKFPQNEAEFSGRQSTYEKVGFEKKQKLNNFYQVMGLDL